MKLIDDWKTIYKKFSVQALIAIGAMQSISVLIPEKMGLHVPFLTGVTFADCLSGATTIVAIIGIVGRAVLQAEDPPP